MGSIVSMDPFRCRMWALHDRLEDHVTEESCREVIASVSKHGQLVPALGRVLRDVEGYDAELIYGARRLFVARYLKKPILVDLHEQILDIAAVQAMDAENRLRSDISPYERGQSYFKWLRSGYFKSQDEIAAALQVSSSQVSRLLKIARLPAVIISAFDSPVNICEIWGLDLSDAVNDPRRRRQTIQKARSIGALSPRPPAREVFRMLLSASARGRKLKMSHHDEVVKDIRGAPLFRIRQQTTSIAIRIPDEEVSAETLAEICRAVTGIVRQESEV